MRTVMPSILSKGRVRWGELGSDDREGMQGAFKLLCPDTGRMLTVISSTGADWKEAGLPGEPWEHVSVSLLDQPTKCPAWPEMAWVKSVFWGPEETVLQLHVPDAEHINFHPGCLHLWKPLGVEIPLPPGICVGTKP